MQDHYDLVIVGGGPAGSTAAYVARTRGLSALVLDRSAFPRDKVCGDGMTPAVVRELSEIGLADVFDGCVPIYRGHVEGPRDYALDVDLSELRTSLGPGYVLPRIEFDHRLIQRAVAAGADLVAPIRELDIELGPGRHTIAFETAGERRQVTCDLLVGADGANSVVRRKLGIPRNSPNSNGVAIRGYADSDAFRPDGKFGATLWFEFTDSLLPAYGWVFPTGDGLCNIGVGLQEDQLKRRKLNLTTILGEFTETLNLSGAGFGPLRDVQGHQLPHVREIPVLAHRGVALVGDAASLINPTTGEGIGYAVASARTLVDNLPADLGDPAALDRSLRRFESQLRGRYRSHFVSSRIAQRMLAVPAWSRLVFRAASNDRHVRMGAVDLLFGSGRITAGTTARIIRSGLTPHRRAKTDGT